MNSEERLKLNIYSDNSLSDEVKNSLIELIEEKASDLSFKDKFVNTTFLKKYTKLYSDYNKKIESAMTRLKKADFKKAKKDVIDAKSILMDLKILVDNTPSALPEVVIGKCVKILTKSVVTYTLQTLTEVLKGNMTKDIREINTKISNTKLDPNERYRIRHKLDEFPVSSDNKNPSLVKSTINQLDYDMFKNAFLTIIGNKSPTNADEFKKAAKARILQDTKLLANISSKIDIMSKDYYKYYLS